MRLEYLAEFLLLAETGNYSAAAERVFLSESTLSRHIMSLEKELGAELFRREPRTVSLSKAGTLLIPYARNIQTAMAEYADRLAEETGRARQTLLIGFSRSITQYGIMDHLLRFRRENPDITVLLTENGAESLWKMVKRRECNFAFCYEYPFFDRRGLELIHLVRDRIAVALPAGHSLSGRSSVTLQQLRGEHYVFPPINSNMYKCCMQLFQDAGYKPMISACAENRHYMLDLVSQGVGITLLEKERFRHKVPPGVRAVDLEPSAEKYLSLIYPAGAQSAAEARFLALMRDRLRAQPDGRLEELE